LTNVQNRNKDGLNPVDLEMTAEEFLNKERCRAETDLIKARITYKVHSNIDLSKSELRYLNEWMAKSSETTALLS